MQLDKQRMRHKNGVKSENSPRSGSGLYRHFVDNISLPVIISQAKAYAPLLFFLILIVGAFLSTRLVLDPTIVIDSSRTGKELITAQTILDHTKKNPPKLQFPLNCSSLSYKKTCPKNYPKTHHPLHDSNTPPPTCPEYFRWIHEDLRPWASTGITRETLERAQETANFRLVILDGKVYIQVFEKSFQTRDVFTLWGFLQLLRRYPGKLPDLELMFDCVDWPVIKAVDYSAANATAPPPLFRYCADDETLDIVFPDWSFWGWSEVNIKPWESLLKELKAGNKQTKWMKRQPYAYWKGNPDVAETRQDLMKCNVSDKQEWGARLYKQDWVKESKQGYKKSDLASQCVHRYKIYIEGSAWSVSEKYILACDSVTLIVKPHYYDFFTRGLTPLHHYWPLNVDDKCKSIKFAVDWGNNHNEKAQEIGKAASDFIQEELKMDYVYDYMFHLLSGYAKLLRFKPEIPPDAVELCSETMACTRYGKERKFMFESLVKSPADTNPCTMPPPLDPQSFSLHLQKNEFLLSQVDSAEKKYWKNRNKQD